MCKNIEKSFNALREINFTLVKEDLTYYLIFEMYRMFLNKCKVTLLLLCVNGNYLVSIHIISITQAYVVYIYS